jgi:acetyl esterase/lipase
MTPVRAAAAVAVFAAIILFAWSIIRSNSIQLTAAPEPTSVPAAEPAEEPVIEPTTAPAQEAPAPAEENQVPAVESSKNIAFTSNNGFPLLDVYAPGEPGPWPVVVVIPTSTGREYMTSISKAIAAEGAVVYNASVLFTVPFSQAIEQAVCAVRFAQSTAADYGGDTGSITLLGLNPGAAVSAVVGLAGDDFEGDCLNEDQSGLPDALVLIEGPYNYITKGYEVIEIDHSFLEDEDPELYRAINPYAHIGRNPDLKVRLVHGLDEDGGWSQTLPQVSIKHCPRYRLISSKPSKKPATM